MELGEHTQTFHVVERESYKDGEIIFEDGTSGDWIYVILRGEVEIYKTVRGKKVVLSRLSEGDVFGEISFIDKKPRSAGARAVGDVTLGLFDLKYLTEEYNKLPNAMRVIFRSLAKRLRKMTNVAVQLAGNK
jgi:CRP-like cAMP-binding protein